MSSSQNAFMVISFNWRLINLVGMSQQAKIWGGLIEVVPWYNKGKKQRCCWGKRRRCSHLHIKAKVLLLFKEEIKDKLPHKVGVQCVIDYFCPTKLEERKSGEESQDHAYQSVHLVTGKRHKRCRRVALLFCVFCGFITSKRLKESDML